VCGKNPEVAALQDLLIYGLKGLSIYADRVRQLGGRTDEETDLFTVEGLFSTVTNVDFDPSRLEFLLRRCYQLKERARLAYENVWKAKSGTEAPPLGEGPATWVPAPDRPGLVKQGEENGVLTYHQDEDKRSALEILTFGLKGMAAYADHAAILGYRDEELFSFLHRALAATADKSRGLTELVDLCLDCGKYNLKAMELLNRAHTERFGHPVPTRVNLGTRAGKAILISGHDLLDLEELLRQTEGKGINVYTHGEMLPAHGYPGLKRFSHLVGNYGGAWQDQQREFPLFPGSILMTTNCLQRPADSYIRNIFTSGLVAWPGVAHIGDRDFTPLIQRALELPGLPEAPGKEILVGFGHQAVLGLADKIIGAVRSGAIRHFFLVGGCDGAKPGRNYYTEFAEKAPPDTVILTLACGKYRFNKQDLGEIDGIPRLLDVGQCNDAYSAIRIAQALAEAFQVGVNQLPLSLILSWYEQKAVAILLTLLHLGIKNIKLGPSLPAFVSPQVLQFLGEKFNLSPISTAEEDLRAILG
jgi:hydroxylamine reductase